MIEGAKAQRILADKAYASKANRASLKGRFADGIIRKAARGRPLRASEKRFNRLISKRRFRVEQAFGTLKRLFGLQRARLFRRRQNSCADGHGRHLVQPPQGRQRDHPQPPKPRNRIKLRSSQSCARRAKRAG